ncbi:MAG: TonB-dependent receptor [Acidobacteriota bacterium]|nr:TonB-dependent receptor [Acidobacteriota bacterium]
MTRKTISLIACLFFIFAGSHIVFAQDEKEQKVTLKENQSIPRPHEVVNVTATMTRKAVKDCSATVSVVGVQDIKLIPANNALGLLNHLPGIFIRRTGDFGRADVDIRGMGERGRKIAILVDGRPEKMGLFGCVITHAFPLDNVERIEVVRGPASVLYGSEALGGVVNIITRRPKEKFETDLTASYGSFNTQQINLSHGGQLKDLSYYFTLDRRSSDGHREYSNYSGDAFTGKIIYALNSKIDASIQGKYFTGKKYEAGPIDFPLEDFWNDYNRGAVDLSVKAEGTASEFFIKAYRNFGHHQFSDGFHSRDYTSGLVLRYTTRRIANNELTIGAEFRALGGKSYNWPKGQWDKNEAAIFMQNEHVFWEKWILSAGARLHRDSLYGVEVCPHLGMVFQMSEKTRFRSSISKGFRSPQINELYMFPAANPELEPERVWSYEAGFEQDITQGISIGGTIFQMKGSNLIEIHPNMFPPPMFRFMNKGTFNFKGAELSLRAHMNSYLSGHLFYTYLHTGENTKGRPGQKVDCSLRFNKKILEGSIQAQYVTDYFACDFSQDPLPSYFLLNSRWILNVSSALEIILDINNILNKDYLVYVDLPGLGAGAYPMPGRSLNIGIRIKP